MSVIIVFYGKRSILYRNLVFLFNRPGSVIVEFNITIETANPKLDVSQPLREAVKSGKVGQFEVDKDYFNINRGILCFVYFFSLFAFYFEVFRELLTASFIYVSPQLFSVYCLKTFFH